MDETGKISLNDRPLPILVKFAYLFCALCFLWALSFGLLTLTSPPETHSFNQFKASAISGMKGVLFMGGLGFLLDKLDETKWYSATPLERKVIYQTRKKKKNNAKNK